MEVIKSIPRGYCHGVVNALNLVSDTIKNNTENKDIYILGEIVHNKNVKKAFEKVGVITLEGDSRAQMLSQIEKGIVIITAHGVDSALIDEAKKKGLDVVDATCKDVKKTQNLIRTYLNDEFDVIFLGKQNHPETEGIINISDKIHLITDKNDVDALIVNNDKIVITNQTTMSKYDTLKLFDYTKAKYPNLTILNEICDATSKRQEIALENAKNADLSLIVGDPGSNNTNKLLEICKNLGHCQSFLIETIDQLKIEWLLDEDVNIVHITSGASTPTILTKEVIDFVEGFDKKNKSTWDNTSNVDLRRIIPRTNQ